NFLRAVRCAWPYRVRLGVSVLCAVLAAVFWGLNFTAIYPVLKIIGSEMNLQQWADGEIDRIRKDIRKHEGKLDDLAQEVQKIEKAIPGSWRDDALRKTTNEQAKFEGRLEAARCELYRYQLLKRYIDMIFPDDRFQTLALVILLVVLAVAIKGF